MVCGLFLTSEMTWKNMQIKFSSQIFIVERNFFYTKVRENKRFSSSFSISCVEKNIYFTVYLDKFGGWVELKSFVHIESVSKKIF